jgi:23S rRNA (adenine2503-C2)-methyltransferase
MTAVPAIQSVTREELAQVLRGWNEADYRTDQILRWIFQRRVVDWSAMTNVPEALRRRLAEAYSLQALQLVTVQGARDTTQKFLWRLADGALIESVLIPANPALYGEASDRHTLCLSTQVGCAYGCRFCASGLEGWKRNLSAAEIVDQVLAVERWHQSVLAAEAEQAGGVGASHVAGERWVNNLVIMGMGEPLANYDALLRALEVLNAPWGGGIGARKITVSTSGLAPQIRRLAEERLTVRLAVSLHGATDEVRSQIMPVNRKFPLNELLAALEVYQEKKGRMITFEYILIAGVNDAVAQTRPLATLARRVHAKVNLIPYNAVDGLPWKRPEESAQEQFLAALEKEGVTATLRREKGHDIDAACGQLRLRTERDLATQSG